MKNKLNISAKLEMALMFDMRFFHSAVSLLIHDICMQGGKQEQEIVTRTRKIKAPY